MHRTLLLATSVAARVVKSSKPRFPQRAALTLTPRAISRVKEIMAEQPGVLGLKVGVRTRGCNGLTYTLEYASEKGKFDEIVEQEGVRIFVDAKAQLSLLGTEMDFQESKLSREFVFNNPNITGTCGCGESFSL